MGLARGGLSAVLRRQSRRSPADPAWFEDIPDISGINEGDSGAVDVLQHARDFDAARHDLASTGAALPSGWSINGSNQLAYSSAAEGSATGLILTLRDKAESDWITRSTAAGVTFVSDFTGAGDFVDANTNGGHVFAGSMDPVVLARVKKDLSDGITGGCCLRIDSPKEVGANSAAWMFPLNSAWTANSQSFSSAEFYIQFRFKIPASRLVLSDCDGNQRGWKWFNLAQYSPTNTVAQSFSNSFAEHVLQDTDQRGFPQAYHRSVAGSFPPFQGFEGGQITLQDVDRGAGFSNVGERYCHYPNGTLGCEYFPVNEWVTFKMRVKIAAYGGSTGNEFDLWMLRRNQTVPVQLFAARNYEVGDPDSNGGGFTGINGGHLLTYETNRVSNSPNNIFDTWHKYDQVLVSTLDPAWPAVGC